MVMENFSLIEICWTSGVYYVKIQDKYIKQAIKILKYDLSISDCKYKTEKILNINKDHAYNEFMTLYTTTYYYYNCEYLILNNNWTKKDHNLLVEYYLLTFESLKNTIFNSSSIYLNFVVDIDFDSLYNNCITKMIIE